MAFRVKDLLINVVSASEAKRALGNCRATVMDCTGTPFSTGGCGTVTTHVCLLVSQVLCCRASMVGPGPVGPGDPVEWVEQLAILKAELKEALEEVERQEAVAEQALKPRDVAEIENLENKLREGLAELERLKSELEGKK